MRAETCCCLDCFALVGLHLVGGVCRLCPRRRTPCICAGRIVDAISSRMESVVWEMEEVLGSSLEVCSDLYFTLLGLRWFGVVL